MTLRREETLRRAMRFAPRKGAGPQGRWVNGVTAPGRRCGGGRLVISPAASTGRRCPLRVSIGPRGAGATLRRAVTLTLRCGDVPLQIAGPACPRAERPCKAETGDKPGLECKGKEPGVESGSLDIVLLPFFDANEAVPRTGHPVHLWSSELEAVHFEYSTGEEVIQS